MAKIVSPIAIAAQQFGSWLAIVTSQQTLNWRDVAERVVRLGELVESLQPAKSRIALTGPNSAEYLLAMLAVIENRSAACPISHRLPEAEIARSIASLQAARLATDEIDWSGLPSKKAAPLREHWDLEQIAALVATSGSSGRPKIAALTVGNHYFSALGSQENIPFGEQDRWLVSLPLYHVGGIALVFRAMLGGGALVVPDANESLIESIRRYRATHVSVVPTQLYRLVTQTDDLPELRDVVKTILIGGGPVSPALIDRALEAGLPIHTSYGLTEMGSQVTTTSAHDSATRLFTSGKLLKYRQMRLGGDGGILVRGETRFAGYVTDNGLTMPFDNDGWFATGDVGEFDADGYLTVRGRKDNMLISGGEKIHPEEIESALSRLPEVLEVVVVPIVDDEFGQRPAVFVRLSDRTPFDETRFIRFLERLMPRFKIPDEFFPWPDDASRDALKPDRTWFARRAADILNR